MSYCSNVLLLKNHFRPIVKAYFRPIVKTNNSSNVGD